LLGLTFFFSHIACFKILFLKLFVYLCMYFLFLVCLATTRCYHLINFAIPLCHDTLLLSLYLVACPTLMLRLIAISLYYYYELHLVVATSSTLLLLWVPPCCGCKLHLSTTILPLLSLCLPFYLVLLLFNLIASSPLLLLYLL